MNNKHIEKLASTLERKEQEKASIRDQIKVLQDRKAAEENAKQDALNSDNNEAFLAAHSKAHDLESQIEGLQELLKAKENQPIKPEVVKALNAAIEDYEKDKSKVKKKYFDLKKTMAEMFADILHAENEMNRIRNYYMTVGKISAFTGEVSPISKIENNYEIPTRFLREELEAMGYDVPAIMIGKDGF